MLKQFGVSTNEIYQEVFFRVPVLNRSTKGATISSFRRAPCSQSQKKARKNEILKQFKVSSNDIYQEHFLKVDVLDRSTKGARSIVFYQKTASKNEILKQFGVSPNEIYQEDFLKVAVLNHSTKGATISSFRRTPCSKPSINRKPA